MRKIIEQILLVVILTETVFCIGYLANKLYDYKLDNEELEKRVEKLEIECKLYEHDMDLINQYHNERID